jgi:hypothetical protein
MIELVQNIVQYILISLGISQRDLLVVGRLQSLTDIKLSSAGN